LSGEEKLVATKALVVAAVKRPKADSGSYCGPAALDFATFMNGCVTALMRTSAERQRSASWDRMREQGDAAHRCTKRFSVRRANPDLVV
jgi:hypothetical protein